MRIRPAAVAQRAYTAAAGQGGEDAPVDHLRDLLGRLYQFEEIGSFSVTDDCLLPS